MNKLLRLTLTEIKLTLREPEAVFFTLAFPGLWMAFFGIMFETPFEGSPISEAHYLLPGAVGMAILAMGFMGLTIILVEYKELGIFRRYKVTPLGFPSLMLAFVLSNMIFVAFGILVVFLVAIFGFDVPVESFGPISHILIVILLGLFTFFSLSFVIASFVKTSRSASAVTMMIFMPMIFLSEFFLPIEGMPSWIQPIARVLPLTPLNITLREMICYGQGLGDNLIQLGIMAIWLVFGLVISFRFFKWE